MLVFTSILGAILYDNLLHMCTYTISSKKRERTAILSRFGVPTATSSTFDTLIISK